MNSIQSNPFSALASAYRLSSSPARAPSYLPPGAGQAIVLASPGIITRIAPSVSAAMIASEGTLLNNARRGDTVGILQMGIPSQDSFPAEWWRIVTPGQGIGYARAVDPQGVHNFQVVKPLGFQFLARPRVAIGAAGYDENMLPEIPAWYGLVSAAGTAAGAYHGYKRNNSVGWAIGWGVLGGLFPVITIPVALIQGFGKRKKK